MKTKLLSLTAGLLLAPALLAADGAALYKSKMCAACHGPGKKGGDLAASKLDRAGMAKYAKDPKGANPKSTMPAFKGSDEELNAILDYLKK